MLIDIAYALLGFIVGGMGTLIGAGGGFVLTPLYIFLYPQASAAQLTAATLIAIAANSSSGSFAYVMRKQVHLPSALLFTLFSLPGVWFGVRLTDHVSRARFEIYFGLIMLLMSVYLFFKNRHPALDVHDESWRLSKKNLWMGCLISLFVGFVASFLGIGGGIIHVPVLVDLLGFPVHLATGTSHLILALTTITASIQHYIRGDLTHNPIRFLPAALGMIPGAQIGARFSKKLKGRLILKCLAVAILLAALRILYSGMRLV